VQVLLALVTGTPRFAQRVFRELQGNGNDTDAPRRLSDLVTTFGEGDETWQTTLERSASSLRARTTWSWTRSSRSRPW
jgi:hypothetical protein